MEWGASDWCLAAKRGREEGEPGQEKHRPGPQQQQNATSSTLASAPPRTAGCGTAH